MRKQNVQTEKVHLPNPLLPYLHLRLNFVPGQLNNDIKKQLFQSFKESDFAF